MATILYRYGKRHDLNVANFEGHQSSINLPEAVRQVTGWHCFGSRFTAVTSRRRENTPRSKSTICNQ